MSAWWYCYKIPSVSVLTLLTLNRTVRLKGRWSMIISPEQWETFLCWEISVHLDIVYSLLWVRFEVTNHSFLRFFFLSECVCTYASVHILKKKPTQVRRTGQDLAQLNVGSSILLTQIWLPGAAWEFIFARGHLSVQILTLWCFYSLCVQ